MSYFKNCFGRKVVYTEDDIVVRKLFLKYETSELQIEDLRGHFANYGTIEDIQLFERPQDKKETTGYVLFEGCRDAADVLAKVMHFVLEYRVYVEAYYSWGQPGVEGIEPSDYTLMRLNDDCLERIYRYLPVPDQLNLARLCRRCPPLYRSINFNMFTSMTLWNVRDFFIYFGSYLREIVGQIPMHMHVRRICQFLSEHCSNLKILRISRIILSKRSMYKLFSQQLLQLEVLEIQYSELTDEYLPALFALRNLRKLALNYNELLTGKHMDCLPTSIESLNLLYCSELKIELLPGICKSLPYLRDLSVRVTQSGSADVFQQLVNYNCCNCLESFAIHSNGFIPPGLKYLAKLPSISKLDFYDCPTTRLLHESLVEHKQHQLVRLVLDTRIALNVAELLQICKLSALRVLALPFNSALDDSVMERLGQLSHLEHLDLRACKKVNENAVLRLLHECGKLHILKLDYCPLLGEQLVHNIIRQLAEEVQFQNRKQMQRQLPLKLTIGGRKFRMSLLQHPRVASRDMVDVSLVSTENNRFQ